MDSSNDSTQDSHFEDLFEDDVEDGTDPTTAQNQGQTEVPLPRDDRIDQWKKEMPHGCPPLTPEDIDEAIEVPDLVKDFPEAATALDAEWWASTEEKAKETRDMDFSAFLEKSKSQIVPSWKVCLRAWRVHPMSVVGSSTSLRFTSKDGKTNFPPEITFRWTRNAAEKFREVALHCYWERRLWLLPAALEWAYICRTMDRRKWTTPTNRARFFLLLREVSIQHPTQKPTQWLERIETSLRERGELPCPYLDLFSAIAEKAVPKSKSRPQPSTDIWEPRPVPVMNIQAVIDALESNTGKGIDGVTSGYMSCQRQVKNFEDSRQGGLRNNKDLPDSDTILSVFPRSAGREVIIQEMRARLKEQGFSIEKTRYMLLHPKLREGCFVAGSHEEEQDHDPLQDQSLVSEPQPQPVPEAPPIANSSVGPDPDSDYMEQELSEFEETASSKRKRDSTPGSTGSGPESKRSRPNPSSPQGETEETRIDDFDGTPEDFSGREEVSNPSRPSQDTTEGGDNGIQKHLKKMSELLDARRHAQEIPTAVGASLQLTVATEDGVAELMSPTDVYDGRGLQDVINNADGEVLWGLTELSRDGRPTGMRLRTPPQRGGGLDVTDDVEMADVTSHSPGSTNTNTFRWRDWIRWRS